MSVSIRVFKNGEVVSEEIFGGKSFELVTDYLNENGIEYHTDKECEEAYEITKNKDVTVMCLDNTNVLGHEEMANFITEYLLDYKEKVFNDIKSLLSK